MHTATRKLNIDTEKMFWILASTLLMLAFLYAYLVSTTIFNVAARQHDQVSLAALSSDTNDLEASYISLQNTITLQLAYSMGFKEVSNPQFLLRKGNDFDDLSFNSLH